MSTEHRQTSFEKYGCPACLNGNAMAGDRHDPECPKFEKPGIVIQKVVYFAHPLRGKTLAETEANRKAASALVARYAYQYRVAPVCAWIHLADEWTEEQGRALGLKIDCRLIEAVAAVKGELWLIGPAREISEGMQIEVNHARSLGIPIIDRRIDDPPAAA